MKNLFFFMTAAVFFIFCGCKGPEQVVCDTLDSVNATTILLDDAICNDIKMYFPVWTEEQRLIYLTKMFPHTDAGSTCMLMSCAEKWDLLLQWDAYAKTLKAGDLPGREISGLRSCIGMYISQKYFKSDLQQDSGKWNLVITDLRDGRTTVFPTQIRTEQKPEKYVYNGDIELRYGTGKPLNFRYNAIAEKWMQVKK